jgi:hypothetical protein
LLPSGLSGDHQTHRLIAECWVAAWHQGVWWPFYLDDVNAGLGSLWPRYYPPLYHAACAVGLSLGLDYWQAAGLTMAIAHSVGAALCYGWLRNHVPPTSAAWGSLAFALAPYTILNIYHRGAFPEAVGLEFLPGILWGCDRVRRRWEWPPALLGMGCFGLLCLCNNPGIVVASYATGIYVLVVALTQWCMVPLLRSLAIPVGGLALSAFFWLPAWAGHEGVQLPSSDLTSNSFSPHFLRLGQFRSFYFADLLDWNIHILWLCWLVAIVAGFWCLRRSRLPGWCIGLVLVGTGLWLCMDWSAWVYQCSPLLGRLQFPWRSLGIVGPGWALLAAYAAHGLRHRPWICACGAGLWMACLALQWTHRQTIEPTRWPLSRTAVLADYLPHACRLPSAGLPVLPPVEPLAGEVRYRVLHWVPGSRELATESDGPFRLLVRTYADSCWKAYDQDRKPLALARLADDACGRLTVEAPAGTTRIELRLEAPTSAHLGRALSAGAVAIIASGWLLQRRSQRRQVATVGGKSQI